MTKEKFNDLLQKARAGNKDSFAKVYNEYYSKMLYVAGCVTGNSEDAQDAVQQAFARFWKFILSKDVLDIDYPSAYLYTIAKRCALEIVIDNDQYKSYDSLEIFATDDSYEERRINDAVVQAAIQELSEPEQAVAIQFFLFKMKIREISEDLGVPVGTIKWRISEIKKKFKNIIK